MLRERANNTQTYFFCYITLTAKGDDMKKELTVKDLENFFVPIDDIAQMLIRCVRKGKAKAFQDERGIIGFEFAIECKGCPDSPHDCHTCDRKSFTFKT